MAVTFYAPVKNYTIVYYSVMLVVSFKIYLIVEFILISICF